MKMKWRVFRDRDKHAEFKHDGDAIDYAEHRSACDWPKGARWTVVYWPKKAETRIFVDGEMLPQSAQGQWKSDENGP